VYCLCVNVYCTTATGCQPNCSLENISYQNNHSCFMQQSSVNGHQSTPSRFSIWCTHFYFYSRNLPSLVIDHCLTSNVEQWFDRFQIKESNNPVTPLKELVDHLERVIFLKGQHNTRRCFPLSKDGSRDLYRWIIFDVMSVYISPDTNNNKIHNCKC